MNATSKIHELGVGCASAVKLDDDDEGETPIKEETLQRRHSQSSSGKYRPLIALMKWCP